MPVRRLREFGHQLRADAGPGTVRAPAGSASSPRRRARTGGARGCRSGASLQSSIVCGRTRRAPQSSGQAGAVSWTRTRWCEAVAQMVEVVDRLALAGGRRSAAGGRGRARRRAPRRARARPRLASPVTWTWRPSAGQWKSRATWGLASASRALRVHSAEVKSEGVGLEPLQGHRARRRPSRPRRR